MGEYLLYIVGWSPNYYSGLVLGALTWLAMLVTAFTNMLVEYGGPWHVCESMLWDMLTNNEMLDMLYWDCVTNSWIM